MTKARVLFLSLVAVGTLAAQRAEAIILASCQSDCSRYPCYSRCVNDDTGLVTTCSGFGGCPAFTAESPDAQQQATLAAIFAPAPEAPAAP